MSVPTQSTKLASDVSVAAPNSATLATLTLPAGTHVIQAFSNVIGNSTGLSYAILDITDMSGGSLAIASTTCNNAMYESLSCFAEVTVPISTTFTLKGIAQQQGVTFKGLEGTAAGTSFLALQVA